MNNPDAKTAANTPPPAPPSMPVEKLIDSMKPEVPLVIEGGAGTFGSGGALPVGNTPTVPSQQP
jgi:pilus assembly protein CpaC